MKRYRVWNVFCHGSVVLSVAFTVLFVIDRINPAMGFLGSDQGDWLLLAFCIMALVNGIMTAIYLFKRENRAIRREMEAQHGGED
jgi:hypothetical protein